MASAGQQTFKLNTGAQIPAMGVGPWQDAQEQYDAVKEVLKVGYRHVDTAYLHIITHLRSDTKGRSNDWE